MTNDNNTNKTNEVLYIERNLVNDNNEGLDNNDNLNKMRRYKLIALKMIVVIVCTLFIVKYKR